MILTFILQDPDSEAGSTETEAYNVRNDYISLVLSICLPCPVLVILK